MPSKKLKACVAILKEIKNRDPEQKTIIFSQWTQMLTLLHEPLKANGITFDSYHGRLSSRQRQHVLREFKTTSKCNVLLMSLRCGNLGLNLTEANNVIFMDLWWNPAVESQATDRVHRIGQKRPVNIYRLTVANTVEERILELQEHKRELAENALAGGKMSARLTLNDLKKLFNVNEYY